MADRRFDYFVILAGMRTGSNLLEETLATFPGIETHGELFNPHFFGRPGASRQFAFDMAARDADPTRILAAMIRSAEGNLPGFRFFDDHDPRVRDAVLSDPRAAKIVLTRDDLDSWVSLAIARRTGQWWLGDVSRRKAAKVAFDAEDFTRFRERRREFHAEIARALKHGGQTAFWIGYDDLFDAATIAGLGRWLGMREAPDMAGIRARVQNPTPVAQKLVDPERAAAHLARLDAVDLERPRSHEPARGPGVKGFVAAQNVGLIYMPVRGAGHDPVPDWIAAADPDGRTETGLTRKELRRWKRLHPGHRGFTVIRHPLPRAWDAFARWIMPENGFGDIRDALAARFGMPVPNAAGDWDNDTARAAFVVFLRFLEANLGGQTSIRVDSAWATQTQLVAAMAETFLPDRLVREDRLALDLRAIADEVGVRSPEVGRFGQPAVLSLDRIIDDEIVSAGAQAYRRDLIAFGYPADPRELQAA